MKYKDMNNDGFLDCSHFEHRRFPKEPPFKGSCIFYSSSCCCVRYPFLFFFTLKQFS